MRRDDIAGDADDEQVAEALAEDQLRGNARIGAAQHDGERLLRRAGTASGRRAVFNKAAIPFAQARERLLSWDH